MADPHHTRRQSAKRSASSAKRFFVDLDAGNRLYLDIVANGIPFLPQVPCWHPSAGLGQLVHLEVPWRRRI